MNTIKIKIKSTDQDSVKKIINSGCTKSVLVAKVLNARGYESTDDIKKFLCPDLDRDWCDPYLIDGMEDVANFLENSLRDNKNILIYGDYDLDGISAVSIMLRGINMVKNHLATNSQIDYFIPDRFSEGYGFSDKSVCRLLKEKPNYDVIITVDCGITGSAQVKTLQKAGREIAITDHHESSGDIPNVAHRIDPKAYPSTKEEDNISASLAGAGVALKLIQVILTRFAMPYAYKELCDIACLGTIADIMPLTVQNRALVNFGIGMINDNPRPCIKALLDVAGKTAGNLDSIDLGFTLVPRLNSAGRLNMPNLAVDLLTSDDYSAAYSLAIQIENLNNTRKELTDSVANDAIYQAKLIINNSPDLLSLVLYGQDWHGGVRGIVAAKIAELFGLCTIVCGLEDGLVVGSGRSVGDIDLHDAIMSCKDLLERFGGHKGACGISLLPQNLDKFTAKLDNHIHTLPKESFLNQIEIDSLVNLDELSLEDVNSLTELGPFGQDNPVPVFAVNNVFIKNARAIGKDKIHLSFVLTDGVNNVSAVKFNCPNIDKWKSCTKSVCAIFTAQINSFRGKDSVQLLINDLIFDKGNMVDKYQKKQINELVYLDSLLNKYDRGIILETPENVSTRLYDDSDVNSSLYSHFKLTEEKSSKLYEPLSNDSINKLQYRKLSIEELKSKLLEEMIGKNNKLHSSQQETLSLLEKNKSCLVVMPTGRGKSLIFQLYASLLAIKNNEMSLFVYPLRALISDQAYHLQNSLKKFGIVVRVLNGQTDQETRKKIYKDMADKRVDIILTTPEYLSIHCNSFANNANISFVVIDEAHHLGQVKTGQRTAYGDLPAILAKLNNPQVLALSATVNDQTKAEIKNLVPVDKIVIDNYERDNLFVDDKRNLAMRDEYLVNLVGSGEKTVIYVNSRDQSVALARMLKSKAPHIAMRIGFYNAGMSKEERKKIESMFRDNDLSVLVATSAFGEGVNISDVRHVCLYHLPFSDVEFNQMSGRCGRDGKPAIIHLMYNSADANINTKILDMTNPKKNDLGQIYLWIKRNCGHNNNQFIFQNSKLEMAFVDKKIPYPAGAVFCAIDIFSELGLIAQRSYYKKDQSYTELLLIDDVGKVKLESSSRYVEGIAEKQNFAAFKGIAMDLNEKELTALLRHPIKPGE